MATWEIVGVFRRIKAKSIASMEKGEKTTRKTNQSTNSPPPKKPENFLRNVN